MRKKLFLMIALVAAAILIFAATSAQTATAPRLKVNDITFNNKYRGIGSENKPETGFFAAKWWKGQPQVMCYKSATQADIPAVVMEEILDHLSANRPFTADEKADENFARREFSLFSIGNIGTKIEAPKLDSGATELEKQLVAKRAELAALEAAESKRQKKAKLVVKAKRAPAVVKKQPVVSAKVQELESGKAMAEKSLGECQSELKKWQSAYAQKEGALETAKGNAVAAKTAYDKNLLEAKKMLAKAQEDGSIFSVVSMLRLLAALIIGAIIGVLAGWRYKNIQP